jgi:hypothetical protein
MHMSLNGQEHTHISMHMSLNGQEHTYISTCPDHVDVQPIPSTLSSLKFDSTLGGCFAIVGSKLACLEIFSFDDDSKICVLVYINP